MAQFKMGGRVSKRNAELSCPPELLLAHSQFNNLEMAGEFDKDATMDEKSDNALAEEKLKALEDRSQHKNRASTLARLGVQLALAESISMAQFKMGGRVLKRNAELSCPPELLLAHSQFNNLEMAREFDKDANMDEKSDNAPAEEKLKRKQSGLMSRILNGLIRSRDDDFERRLEHISKDETTILSRIRWRSQSWARMRMHLILFSVVLEGGWINKSLTTRLRRTLKNSI